MLAAFCAKGDTRTPVRLAFVINTVNIPARALAFWTYGLVGMAITMSAMALLALTVNVIYLERSIPRPARAWEGGDTLAPAADAT